MVVALSGRPFSEAQRLACELAAAYGEAEVLYGREWAARELKESRASRLGPIEYLRASMRRAAVEGVPGPAPCGIMGVRVTSFGGCGSPAAAPSYFSGKEHSMWYRHWRGEVCFTLAGDGDRFGLAVCARVDHQKLSRKHGREIATVRMHGLPASGGGSEPLCTLAVPDWTKMRSPRARGNTLASVGRAMAVLLGRFGRPVRVVFSSEQAEAAVREVCNRPHAQRASAVSKGVDLSLTAREFPQIAEVVRAKRAERCERRKAAKVARREKDDKALAVGWRDYVAGGAP